jgi:predicted nuclease of predicted toxin-antitoxin system
VPLRFLIDENLTRRLVDTAHARLHVASYVPHVGLSGTTDELLLRRAIEGDWTIVTNNVDDFVTLVESEEIHPGVVLVITQTNPDVQVRLFEQALDAIGDRKDLINVVVHVDVDDATRRRLSFNEELTDEAWVELARTVRANIRFEQLPG